MKCNLRDLGIYGMILLKMIIRKYGVKVWNGFNWLGTEYNYEFC
jgi:hypothetical protein